MSGPHKAVAAARNAVKDALDRAGLGPGDRLVVAVSGGSDSMALAHAALFVARHAGLLVATVTVDHGLRSESADEAEHVRALMEVAGADPAVAVHVDVSAPTISAGPEGGARSARYAALADTARQFTRDGAKVAVLLGHTADDQAETVLLGLGRGSGARSISGMRAVGPLPEFSDVMALRPFLNMRREELRAALRSTSTPWVEDPTNAPDSEWRAADGALLRRAAIRHEALPALERAVGSGVVQALARTAHLLQADDDALEAWAGREREVLGERPSIAKLRELPVAVRTRVIRHLALDAGARSGELTGWHIDHIDELITGPGGGRGVDLPGIRVAQQSGCIVFGSVGLNH
ncbi:tRNA lysidine(34) synthetase TilS [Changpingibacter yushuensis]|uniref:tRNA lysidine(34) synthetase TilS n=1 Tax=Changpingibacter yushuensis TaxID=2758440 RepID=UPI0015F36549|nr:tRNA lysidine(34) synthetase TilS [Changpingibacter yushuensis]